MPAGHNERGQPRALCESPEDALGIEMQDDQACDRDGARRQPGRECSGPEAIGEGVTAFTCGIAAEEDGRKVRGACDGEHADRDRGRVEPARDEAAAGVADMDLLGGQRADHGAERERRQDRRDGEKGVEATSLPGSRGSRAEGIGASAEHNADARDEERDRER